MRSGWQPDGTYWRAGQHISHWSTLGLLANVAQLIDWFDDFLGPHPYAALSNFYEGEPLSVAGFVYRTAEHAFHAGKAVHDIDRQRVADSKDASEAKLVGRTIEMRDDWDNYRVQHMRSVLVAKFAPGRSEAAVLAATSTAHLIEGTLWRDEFWGVDLEQPHRPGRNILGKLLMERRAAL